MDSSLYTQQSQSQSQYSSPLYMQHIYPQQQYQVYGIVPPTWTPSPTPYFETPLVRAATLPRIQSKWLTNKRTHAVHLLSSCRKITLNHIPDMSNLGNKH